jgi:hypothetical protein
MCKNCFSKIIEWPHHPNMIVMLGVFVTYLISFINMPGADIFSDALAALWLTAIIGPFVCFVLFIPYFISTVVIATLFSLYQAIKTRLNPPFPPWPNVR